MKGIDKSGEIFSVINNQYFTRFEHWEDFKNGMYQMTEIADKDIKLVGAIHLLKTPAQFYLTCKELLKNWPVASKVNLSNLGQNRRAWLGAAACCLKYGTPEYLTRIAWSLLNKEDQANANSAADKIINEFERLNQSNYAQTLFEC